MSLKKDVSMTGGLSSAVEKCSEIAENLAKDIIINTTKCEENNWKISGDKISEEDKSYFEKFGYSIEKQIEVVAQEGDFNLETMGDEFEELINNINNLTEDNEPYYIEETAQLACSMQTNEEQTLRCKNGIIKSIPNMERENEKGEKELLSQLRIPDDRPAKYTIHSPAIVTDTKGGLRDEIRKVKQESETVEGVNIISFGNCQHIKDNTILEELAQELYDSIPASERCAALAEIEEKMIKAIEQEYGTCYCFMKSESEWENLPAGFSLDSGSFNYDATKESTQRFGDIEAINMMSMLFCRRGGIITPLNSGQLKDFYLLDEDIREDIRQGLYTLDDFYYLIYIALQESRGYYEGMIAITYEVLNRARINKKSIADVVKSSAYGEFNESYFGYVPEDGIVKEAVLAVLRGEADNPIRDIQFHFGKKSGYDIWCEPDKCLYAIVIGEGPLRNVFYEPYGSVHNMQTARPDDAIVIYDHISGEWLIDGVVWDATEKMLTDEEVIEGNVE